MPGTFHQGLRAAAILAALSLLAACGSAGDGGNGDGGGGDGGGGEAGTSDVGILSVSEVESEADASVAVSGSGGFWRSDPAIDGAFFADPWVEIVDTCEVFDAGDIPDEDPFGDFPVPDTVDITYIDAGTPITVASTGDAAYLELDRETFELGGQTTIFYSSVGEDEEPLAGPLADGLSASIPGADFPAVAAATFPAVDAFALTAPADPGAVGSVTSTTEFTWTAGTGAGNAIVMFDVTSFDAETFTTTVVSCYAEDDGSFEFPADVQTELGAEFSGSVGSAGRQSVRAQEVGDEWLLLLVERTIEYDTGFVFAR